MDDLQKSSTYADCYITKDGIYHVKTKSIIPYKNGGMGENGEDIVLNCNGLYTEQIGGCKVPDSQIRNKTSYRYYVSTLADSLELGLAQKKGSCQKQE